MMEMVEGRTFILGLPWGSKIWEVHDDAMSLSFILIIHHLSFPEVEEGKEMPFMTNECYTVGRKGPAGLVAKQSQQSDLWLATEPGSYAYKLQKALRALHDTIERPDSAPTPKREVSEDDAAAMGEAASEDIKLDPRKRWKPTF